MVLALGVYSSSESLVNDLIGSSRPFAPPVAHQVRTTIIILIARILSF